MIEFKDVKYNYLTYEKEDGLWSSIKDLFHRKYETIEAVKSISFEIGDGEIVGLLGPNGAGKSTIIKCLVGILKPHSGSILIDSNTPFQRKKDFLKSIGVIFGQKSQLLWDLPAIDTLLMLKEIYEIDKNDFDSRLEEMTLAFGVHQKLKIPVRKLSLGERMKLEIICSLIHNPKILFLDEPTIGVDLVSQKAIHDFLKMINKITRTTIILTSHYVKDIEALCDRVIVIKGGEKMFDIKTQELLQKYTVSSSYIIEFYPDKVTTIKFTEDTNIKQIDYHRFEVVVSPENTIQQFLDKNMISLDSVYSMNTQQSSLEDILYDIYIK